MTTPAITLTATLDDLTGAAAGSTPNPAKLRIALCGFGPLLPAIAGTAMLARTGPFTLLATSATPISTLIWGNDQITPAGTYYSIEILDGEDNVVQCGAYRFTGSGAQDLSNAVQIVPPYGFSLPRLSSQACTGAVPGTVYNAPGIPIAVFYNGAYLPPGKAFPILSYTLAGLVISLNFTTELEDRVDALCIL